MVRYETQTSSSGYSVEREAEAQAWIEEITERAFKASFGEELRDGTILCEVMNAIKPGLIRKINKSTIPFKQMENVSNFIKGCRTVGVPEYSLFETVDLFELKDLGIVVKCLHALGGAAQANCPEFKGPHLGLKASPKTSPNQKRQPTTSSFLKPTVTRGASWINASSAPGPKQTSPPRQVPPAQRAYPIRDEPSPPVFKASTPPAAPVYRSDKAKPPPPPYNKSATAWSDGAEPQLPPPPPYQEKPCNVEPSSGHIAAMELEDIAPKFSQVLSVAESSPKREPSKNEARSQGFSPGRQNGTSSPSLPLKHQRQADPSPKSTPYYSSSASTATAQSFSPGTQTGSLSPQSDASSATSRQVPVTVARGGGFGLDAELAQKREANYNHGAEKEAQDWIEAVTGERFNEDFGEELRNGRRLCLLINAIKPGAVRRVNDSRMPFKQMENISNFLKACRAVGVAEHSLFETVDLFEGKDLGLVVRCVHALGQTIQTTCPEFNGPRLGIKQTEANKREWTPEQQQRQALYSAGTMSHVMAGSSKTMERGTIVKEGVTFGAATCGMGDTSVVARWMMGSQPTMERLTVSKSGPTFGAEYAGKADPTCSTSMFTRDYN